MLLYCLYYVLNISHYLFVGEPDYREALRLQPLLTCFVTGLLL